MSKKILIVDDEQKIVEICRDYLKAAFFDTVIASDGPSALAAVERENPDLIILDLMLPGMDGLDVCREVRREHSTPIIMLTARVEEADKLIGLELGADDYITKPFSIKVLIARARSLLRRKRNPLADPAATVRAHDLIVNPGRHEVLVKGKPVEMTFSELRILHFLASRPGWVMTRDQIVDAVRGTDYAVTDRAVDVQIVGIRKKLGARADYIETVRGVGYRFKE